MLVYNFGKIVKIVATGCHVLKKKCTNFDFVWGFASDPAGVANSAPPDHLAGFQGHISKGKEGRGREREVRGRKGPKRREGKRQGEWKWRG